MPGDLDLDREDDILRQVSLTQVRSVNRHFYVDKLVYTSEQYWKRPAPTETWSRRSANVK